MKRRKTLQELTIKDNFRFGAVMCDEQICKRFLEITLGFPIAKVVVSKEKSIVYHPQYKGVRLDVYAQDANNTHYNVEMQAVRKDSLFRRARYYHSQIDMELLLSGTEYSELPDSYVIFICDFDPFEMGKYRYTVMNHCREINHQIVADGNTTIFLSTKGTDSKDVPEELVKFLKYVGAKHEDSTADFQDEFVSEIQKSVNHVKRSRDMEERFMLFEEMLRDERKEGKIEATAEYVIELLSELGELTEDLRKEILEETDLPKLKRWLKTAAKADTIEQFKSVM